jgi:hypothetical protein
LNIDSIVADATRAANWSPHRALKYTADMADICQVGIAFPTSVKLTGTYTSMLYDISYLLLPLSLR